MDWQFIGVSFGDTFIIDGIDIFKEKWENTGEVVRVKDPKYKQLFTFKIWKLKNNDKGIKFAAGEFSNSVFGIYVKKK